MIEILGIEPARVRLVGITADGPAPRLTRVTNVAGVEFLNGWEYNDLVVSGDAGELWLDGVLVCRFGHGVRLGRGRK